MSRCRGGWGEGCRRKGENVVKEKRGTFLAVYFAYESLKLIRTVVIYFNGTGRVVTVIC